jgi:hypothetical protein
MPGHLQQWRAEIHPGVPAAVSTPHQFARHFPVPAPQVEDGFMPCQTIQHPLHPRLEMLPRGREFMPEGLVELSIQSEQARNRLTFHMLSHYTV